MLSLQKILDLDGQQPEDLHTQLLRVRAQKARISEQIHKVMETVYDDFTLAVSIVETREAEILAKILVPKGGDA